MKLCILASYNYCNKVPQTELFIFSQFWRLEVQNQGVNKAMLSLTPVGKNSFLPLLFLASDDLLVIFGIP